MKLNEISHHTKSGGGPLETDDYGISEKELANQLADEKIKEYGDDWGGSTEKWKDHCTPDEIELFKRQGFGDKTGPSHFDYHHFHLAFDNLEDGRRFRNDMIKKYNMTEPSFGIKKQKFNLHNTVQGTTESGWGIVMEKAPKLNYKNVLNEGSAEIKLKPIAGVAILVASGAVWNCTNNKLNSAIKELNAEQLWKSCDTCGVDEKRVFVVILAESVKQGIPIEKVDLEYQNGIIPVKVAKQVNGNTVTFKWRTSYKTGEHWHHETHVLSLPCGTYDVTTGTVNTDTSMTVGNIEYSWNENTKLNYKYILKEYVDCFGFDHGLGSEPISNELNLGYDVYDDEDPWNAGYTDYFNGASKEDNPYEEGTGAYEMWQSGYSSGENNDNREEPPFNESTERKLSEGKPPKWKQQILNDENTLLDHFSVDDFDEVYEGFSYEDFLDEVHAVNTYGFDEKIEKLAALSLWKDLTDDYKKYYELEQHIYKDVCDEYQEKYGRKIKPQPYIKDPTDASEIFDKMALI